MPFLLEIENLFNSTGFFGDFFQNLIRFFLLFFLIAGIFGIGFNIFKWITRSEKPAEAISGIVLNIVLILAVFFIQNLIVVGDANAILTSFNDMIR